jgi:hypothetical protein
LYLANVAHVARHFAQGHDLVHAEPPLQSVGRLRSLASRLLATLWTIPCYGLWSTLRVVRTRVQIEQATKGLIGWSNSLFDGQPQVHRDSIVRQLGIPRLDE